MDAARARPQNARPSFPLTNGHPMGRGDKKTRRGKIARGSFGNRRPRLRNQKKSTGKPAGKPAAK